VIVIAFSKPYDPLVMVVLDDAEASVQAGGVIVTGLHVGAAAAPFDVRTSPVFPDAVLILIGIVVVICTDPAVPDPVAAPV
jgi:hypothetical protein